MINNHFTINNTSLSNTGTQAWPNSTESVSDATAFGRHFRYQNIDEPYFTPSKTGQAFIDDLNDLEDSQFHSKYFHLQPDSDKSLLGRTIEWLKGVAFPAERERRSLSKEPTSATPTTSSPCQHEISNAEPKVLADYHTNKQIQSIHLALNCKTDHKITNTHIVNNGYELRSYDGSAPCADEPGYLGFGASTRPMVGGSPLDNLHYYEWQLNTARIAGLDGFIVEWGFPGENTSPDRAILNMKTVLAGKNRGHEFALVPLWIPQWTVKPSVRLTPEQKEAGFKARLEDMIERYYRDPHCTHYEGNPLMFMLNFWGNSKSDLVLDRQELEQFFRNNPDLAKVRLAYRMSGRRAWQAAQVNQTVSNFPWVAPRERPAKESDNPFIANNFVSYGMQEDIRRDVNALDDTHRAFQHHLPIKTLSVYPGVDTRGAPWSACNSYLPEIENGQDTFESSWIEVRKKKPDLIIVETFNDFSEGTQIEPTNADRGKRLSTTAMQTCLTKLKNITKCNLLANDTPRLVQHAARLYDARIKMDKLSHVLSKDKLALAETRLNYWANSIFNVKADKADLRAQLFENAFTDLPFRTFSTILRQQDSTLPSLLQSGSNSLLLLPPTLPLNNADYFTEGDVQLRIRTENGLPVKVSLKAIYSYCREDIAEIYTPYDQLDTIIRIPLTPVAGKHYGQLAGTHQIKHQGCSVELLEIRTRSFARIDTSLSQSSQP